MEVMLGLSILLNVLQAILLLVREHDHEDYEEEQKLLNRALREELQDLYRQGRVY